MSDSDGLWRGTREWRDVTHELFDARECVRGQRDVGCGKCFVDVIGIASADDRDLNRGIGERPGNGELTDRDTELAPRERGELVDSFKIVQIHLALEIGALRTPVIG